MKLPKSITFIRHGESEGNVEARLKEQGLPTRNLAREKGNHLFDLSPLGILQAKKTGEYIKKNNLVYDTYMVSQYLRAQKTFEHVFPGKRACEVRSDLNEYDRGYYHLYFEELDQMFPQEKESFELKGKFHHRGIGGENYMDLEQRIRSFITWLALFHSDEDVVAVGHGFWMKTAWSVITREPRPAWHVPNAAIMTFKRSQNGKKLEFVSIVDPVNM